MCLHRLRSVCFLQSQPNLLHIQSTGYHGSTKEIQHRDATKKVEVEAIVAHQPLTGDSWLLSCSKYSP